MIKYSYSDFFNEVTKPKIDNVDELYEIVCLIIKCKTYILLSEIKHICNKPTCSEDHAYGFLLNDYLDYDEVFEWCDAIINDVI